MKMSQSKILYNSEDVLTSLDFQGIHHTKALLILLLGSKPKAMLAKQPCIQTKMVIFLYNLCIFVCIHPNKKCIDYREK